MLYNDEVLNFNTAIVRIGGTISSEDGSKLLEYFNGMIPKYTNIIIDLQDVNFISSSGFGAFINTHKKMNQDGKKFLIISIPSKSKQSFELLNLHYYFHILPDLNAAKDFLNLK